MRSPDRPLGQDACVMAFATRVYELRYSIEEDRPMGDFQDPVNKAINWRIPRVDATEEERMQYEPFHVIVRCSDALDWDFYSVPGTLGLFSQRAMQVIYPFASQHFVFLEATLNDIPYFVPFQKSPLDCLDREHSVLVPFPSNPVRVMRIEKHAFHAHLINDPLVFCHTDYRPDFLATQSIPGIVEDARLRGFAFKLLWDADVD